MRFTASPAAARALSPASKRSTSTAKIHCRPRPQTAVCQRMAFRLVESSHASSMIATSPSNPVNRAKLFSLLRELETVGKDLFEAIVFPAREPTKNDPGGGQHKLAQDLKTSTTWRTSRLVQIGNGTRQHAHLRSVLGDGANHSGTFRANSEAVRRVLHVGAR